MDIRKELIKKYISIIIFDFLVIVCLSVFIYAWFFRNFPTRFEISAMDKYMSLGGEHITYYLLVAFGFGIGIFYIIRIVIAIKLAIKISITKYDFKQKKLYFLFYLLLLFFIIFIPIFILFFYYKKIFKFNTELKKSKKIKLFWKTYICLIPIMSLSCVTPVLISVNKKEVHIDKEAIASNLTYSTNNENLIYLYFDRSMGLLWNILLYIDDIINGNNSFIYSFPEFKSYLNCFPNNLVTNLSNLTLWGGLYFSPILLGKDLVNPITNKKYNSYTQQSYLDEILKVSILNMKKYNFSNICYMDLPYYGEKFNSLHGEYKKMNDKFKEYGENIYSTSSAAILKYFKKEYKDNNYDSANYWKTITESYEGNYHFIFDDTEGSVVKYIFNQNTHSPYIVEKNDKLVSTNEHLKNFIKSMWFSIQKIKDYLNILKSVSHKKGGTIYDHSMIIILSDHGTNLSNDYVNTYKELWNKYKLGTYKEYEITKNFFLNNGSLNSVFMMKPFIENKYSNKEFFDLVNFISLSDIQLIVENEIYKLNNNSNNLDSSIYFPTKNFDDIKNNSKYSWIFNNVILNPLINTNNLNKRYFEIYWTSNWMWEYNNNKFPMSAMNYFDLSSGTNLYNLDIKYKTL